MQCRPSKDIRPALTGGEFIRNSNVILWNRNATCKQNLSRSFRMSWHRADVGARRQRPCGNCVHSFYPHLVQLFKCLITEVYYPTVDRLQLRDLQYLITDGNIFFHEEKRHLKSQFERLRFHPNQRDLHKLRPGMSVTPKVHLD